jgi:chromosomal replication initiation ATPase DnaA
MNQLAIALPRRTAFGRADFFISESNAEALAALDRWPDWPAGTLVLSGPPQSGKTHLAHLWRERAGAEILDGRSVSEATLTRLLAARPYPLAVDDAERAPEGALFHLYNAWSASRAGLLLIAGREPARWPIALADLRSRLLGALSVAIAEPDDALLACLLVKHFADRQLRVAPEALSYLLLRMERSFASAASLVARLDAASLAKGRPIGVALVREILREGGGHVPPGDLGVT